MNKRAIVPERPAPPQSAPARGRPPLLAGAEFVIGAAVPAQLPLPGPPEIAFAGRSNAGKSSAINVLANRHRLAFASRTPGRTQQINFFRLPSGALVADLPGYGYAAVARAVKRSWQDFLWHYVSTRSTLVGLVLVADIRHGLKPLDFALLEVFLRSGRPVLILATKADKLGTAERRRAVVRIREQVTAAFPAQGDAVTVVPFSATARQGIDAAEAVLGPWISPG